MIVIVIPPAKGRDRREGLTMTTISSNNRCMHTKTMVTAKTTTTDGFEQKPTNFAESSGGAERRSSRPPKDSALDRRSVLVADEEPRAVPTKNGWGRETTSGRAPSRSRECQHSRVSRRQRAEAKERRASKRRRGRPARTMTEDGKRPSARDEEAKG